MLPRATLKAPFSLGTPVSIILASPCQKKNRRFFLHGLLPSPLSSPLPPPLSPPFLLPSPFCPLLSTPLPLPLLAPSLDPYGDRRPVGRRGVSTRFCRTLLPFGSSSTTCVPLGRRCRRSALLSDARSSLSLWTSFLHALLVSLPPGTPFVSLAPCTLLVPAKPGGLLRPPRWRPAQALSGPHAPPQRRDVMLDSRRHALRHGQGGRWPKC